MSQIISRFHTTQEGLIITLSTLRVRSIYLDNRVQRLYVGLKTSTLIFYISNVYILNLTAGGGMDVVDSQIWISTVKTLFERTNNVYLEIIHEYRYIMRARN